LQGCLRATSLSVICRESRKQFAASQIPQKSIQFAGPFAMRSLGAVHVPWLRRIVSGRLPLRSCLSLSALDRKHIYSETVRPQIDRPRYYLGVRGDRRYRAGAIVNEHARLMCLFGHVKQPLDATAVDSTRSLNGRADEVLQLRLFSAKIGREP